MKESLEITLFYAIEGAFILVMIVFITLFIQDFKYNLKMIRRFFY